MSETLNNPLFERSLPLLKESGIRALKNAKVAIFGLGGVGSYAAEALARAGIGHLELIDKDIVEASNLNRQLCALHSTIGQPKVDVISARLKDINPEAAVISHHLLYQANSGLSFLVETPTFIVDAIDDVNAKVDLIVNAQAENIPIVSAMGAGNKYDPTAFQITDIFKTCNDPLAKVMRGRLKKANIKKHTVVFSPEKPAFKSPGMISSLSYVPSVCGLLCAYHVVKCLVEEADSHVQCHAPNQS